MSQILDILGGILEANTNDRSFLQCNNITSYWLASNDLCRQLVATIDCGAFKNFKYSPEMYRLSAERTSFNHVLAFIDRYAF